MTQTIHLKKPKAIKATAKEDFGDFSVDTHWQETVLNATFEEVSAPPTPNPSKELDELTKLDVFAMLACAGISKRLEDPVQVAQASYAVGKQMLVQHEYHAQKKAQKDDF